MPNETKMKPREVNKDGSGRSASQICELLVRVGSIAVYRSSTHYIPDSTIWGKVDHVLHTMIRYVCQVGIKGVH
jgi:hypothetical protein